MHLDPKVQAMKSPLLPSSQCQPKAGVGTTSNANASPNPRLTGGKETAPAVRLSMKRLVSKVPDPGVAETDSLVSRLVWIGHVFS